jgi:hypothetical protein
MSSSNIILLAFCGQLFIMLPAQLKHSCVELTPHKASSKSWSSETLGRGGNLIYWILQQERVERDDLVDREGLCGRLVVSHM